MGGKAETGGTEVVTVEDSRWKGRKNRLRGSFKTYLMDAAKKLLTGAEKQNHETIIPLDFPRKQTKTLRVVFPMKFIQIGFKTTCWLL